MKRDLSPELVSLIHYVELNKTGWWDKAAQRLIQAVFWLSSRHLTLDEIRTQLAENFGANLTVEQLRRQVERLLSSQTLIQVTVGLFKLSEQAREEFAINVKKAEDLDINAKNIFVLLAQGTELKGIDGEALWEDFNKELLTPLIQEMGAKLYEAVSGGKILGADHARFSDFLCRYANDVQPAVRATVAKFLDPSNSIVRSYVLRQLNTYFLLEAGNLSEKTLNKLSIATEKKLVFNVFCDTNFFFSILGLHENPSNDAAKSLLELIKKIRSRVELKLFVLPITIDETRHWLSWRKQSLRHVILTPKTADLVLDSNLGGIYRRFAEACRGTGYTLTADEFFDPYLNNLVLLLREKGIELWNEDTSKFTVDRKVIDDLLGQQEFQEKRSETVKQKTYEQLEHDLVLWHFVQGKRQPHFESPFEAEYWVATVDYRLLGFDAYRKDKTTSKVPICLHPLTLIQMLQFWVPRSAEFEEAVLGTLRLPALFQPFDLEAEAVSLKIIRTLARFENVEDMSTETLRSILVDNAVRQKMSVEEDADSQVTLIRDALATENKRIAEALQSEQERSKRLHENTTEQSERIKILEGSLATKHNEVGEKDLAVKTLSATVVEREGQIAEKEKLLAEEKAQRAQMENRLQAMEKSLLVTQEQAAAELELRGARFFLLRSGIFFVLSLLGGYFLALLLPIPKQWGVLQKSLLIEMVIIGVAVLVFEQHGNRYVVIKNSKNFGRLLKMKYFIFSVLGVGVLGNATWDLIKRIFSNAS